MKVCGWQTHCCQKLVFQTKSMIFVSHIKSYFIKKQLIFLFLQMYFRGWYIAQLHRHIPQEGGWDIGAGRSSSNQPNSRILIETPCLAKPSRKKWQKESLWIHFNGKNTLNYFWLNAFVKVKNLKILPTTFIVTVERSTTYDGIHSAKSKFWQTFLVPSLSL